MLKFYYIIFKEMIKSMNVYNTKRLKFLIVFVLTSYVIVAYFAICSPIMLIDSPSSTKDYIVCTLAIVCSCICACSVFMYTKRLAMIYDSVTSYQDEIDSDPVCSGIILKPLRIIMSPMSVLIDLNNLGKIIEVRKTKEKRDTIIDWLDSKLERPKGDVLKWKFEGFDGFDEAHVEFSYDTGEFIVFIGGIPSEKFKFTADESDKLINTVCIIDSSFKTANEHAEKQKGEAKQMTKLG